MSDTVDIRALARRLIAVRAGLLGRYPFFGRLLLRLRLGFADCGTAYTDMERIVFDPAFGTALSDGELEFLFLHELMHCVLRHCVRREDRLGLPYNIACDIVVNSFVLELLREKTFTVDGEEVAHLTPYGEEGRKYTAEEVYDMLMKKADGNTPPSGCGPDTHEPWEGEDMTHAAARWDGYVREAESAAGMTGVSVGLQRQLERLKTPGRVNWRQLLHDFIRHDRHDYVYEPPDRRFQGDVIMPSFQADVTGQRVDELWFYVDTSGSVSNRQVAAAYREIREAVEQVDGLTGRLAFFDSAATEPVPFESVEELDAICPVGGGGTDFRAIFKGLEDPEKEERPNLIVVITDGYARFPDESAAAEIPVIWIITDSAVEPPWGECVHIGTD